MVNSVLAVYSTEFLNASPSQVGLIVAVFFISASLLKIPYGVLFFGKRALYGIALSFTVLAIAPPLYTIIPTVETGFLLRVIHGFAHSLFVTTALSGVSILGRPERTPRAIAIYTMAASVGLVAGPAISTAVVANWGIKAPFLVAGLLGIVGLPLAISIIRFHKLAIVPPKIPRIVDSLGLIRNRTVLISALCFLSVAYGLGVLVAFAPLHAKFFFSFPDSFVTGLFLGYSSSALVSRIAFERFAQRANTQRWMTFALIVSIVFLSLLAISPGPELFIVAFVLLGTAQGLVFPVGAVMTYGATPAKDRVLGNAIYLMGFDIGSLIGPLISVPVVIFFGIPAALAVAALAPATALVLLRMSARRRA